jgi:hypothetical protein
MKAIPGSAGSFTSTLPTPLRNEPVKVDEHPGFFYSWKTEMRWDDLRRYEQLGRTEDGLVLIKLYRRQRTDTLVIRSEMLKYSKEDSGG